MSWTKPTTAWETAETPFSTNTGVLRVTLIGDNGAAIATREVLVGDLLMSRETTAADKNLIVPGGLLFGRRTADSLPPSFTSRVLSRSHAQLLIDPKGRIYIADLGSMHGTKIEGTNGQPLPARVPTQLWDGDVVTLGKCVESKNENHAPLKMRINLRFDKDSSTVRNTLANLEFATKVHVAQMAKDLGLTETSSPSRRRGYGLDESMLYESEPEDLLPRGGASDAAEVQPTQGTSPLSTKANDDDDIVFLSASPAKARESSPKKEETPSPAFSRPHFYLFPDLSPGLVQVPESVPHKETGAAKDATQGAPEDEQQPEPELEKEDEPAPMIPSSFPAEDEESRSVVSEEDDNDNDKEHKTRMDDDDESEIKSIHEGFLSEDEDGPVIHTAFYEEEVDDYDCDHAEDEHEYDSEDDRNSYASSDHGSISSFSRSRSNSVSHSENEEESEDDHADSSDGEHSSEASSSHDEEDDDESQIESDNESTAPFKDEETPGEIEWRSQNIFSFSIPSAASQSLAPAAEQAKPQEAAADVGDAEVSNDEEEESDAEAESVGAEELRVSLSDIAANITANLHSDSQVESFRSARSTFPPSPPLSDRAEVCGPAAWWADDDSRQAIRAPANILTLRKRKFDEFESQQEQVDAGTNPVVLPTKETAIKDAVQPPAGKIRRLAANAGLLAVGIAIGSIGTIAGLLQMAD